MAGFLPEITLPLTLMRYQLPFITRTTQKKCVKTSVVTVTETET